MQEQVPTAKITRPTVSGIFQRERLFRLMDDNRKRPVLWVSGPAGSGKTTLVASYLDARNLPCLWYIVDEGDADIATFFSYMTRAAGKEPARDRKPLPLLTPEYLQGVPTFTKRYFENLCKRFNPPFALVFDNYQDVSDGSDFHDMIVCGLDAVPDGINVIIMSRNEPPRQFARLRANSKIDFIGRNEIRFTRKESREVVRMYGQENLTDEALSEVYRKTEGWMAGLVLFMEGTKRAGMDQTMLNKIVPETIFDYFATEIFDRTDSVTREFLLKTSVLPSMTSQIAERLTGVPASAEILSQLYKSHYFIEMRTSDNPVYHYHPLFREFLLAKMKNLLSAEDRTLLLRDAARLLEESGQVEHAVFLLRDARDWEGLVRLILAHAQSLMAQGRASTLQEWLMGLPEEIVGNTPWLLYWMGICRMPFNLLESRGYLERAFDTFKLRRDGAGLFLSWSGIVDTFVFEGGDFSPLDRWIDEFDALRLEYPEYPSPEIHARATAGIFCALMYRQPGHFDLPLWAGRVEEIVFGSKDVRLQATLSSQLILYYTFWTGDLAKAKMLVDALNSSINISEVDPLSFIVWKAIQTPYYWLKADYGKCMDAVNDGLKTANETGIHVWDFMLCSLGAAMNTTYGKPGEAWKFLDRMRSAMNLSDFLKSGYYRNFAAFTSLYQEDVNAAYEHARECFAGGLKAGSPFYTAHARFCLGMVLLERNEREEGLAYLASAKDVAKKINCKTAEYLSFIGEAWYFLRKGEELPGLDPLRIAMAIGREQGFVNSSLWRPDLMSFLCAKALENGIETDYVRELIKKRNLMPPDVTQSNMQSSIQYLKLEDWPWPLKIYTLGKFQIVKNDVPVTFSGKVQQKPLALLKAIIALGGRDASRQRLTDDLWPEADGAQAHKSFETALHRLRRVIGNDNAVLLNQGLVTLDSRYSWVDVFALECFFARAEETFKRKPTNDTVKSAIQLTDSILNLYRGHFLERETEKPWTISLRERLRAKFLDFIVRSGRFLENAGQIEQAIEYLEKGLDRDSTYEEIYQQLMSCYHKLNRTAAAREAYRRCRMVLSTTHGVEPSQKTKEIYSWTNQSSSNE